MYFHLSGRLGNRLFQWAFAHQLYNNYGEKIIFFTDKIHHPKFIDEASQLDLLNCNHISSYMQSDIRGIQLAMLDKISTISPRMANQIEIMANFIRTKNSYELPLLPNRTPSLVTGFYINKRTVLGMEEILFSELTAILKDIAMPMGVPNHYQVLHIRRGDYLTTATGYGILEERYYLENLDTHLPVIICTDSPQDASTIIVSVSPVMVFDPKNSSAWQTLKIMSESQRLIMGNSTLSWWGGFMAKMNGATVIQPEPFYRGNKIGNESLIFNKFIQKKSYL